MFSMRIALATDHAGFELKETIKAFLENEGHEVVDCGAHEFVPNDDYPGYIKRAAQKIQSGEVERGIIFGASGQGEAIAANRFPGVRAVVYYADVGEQLDATGKTLNMIISTREHNNANVLSIGARFISEEDAKDAVRLWLATPFSGEERHRRRIVQIDSDRQFSDGFDVWNGVKKETHERGVPRNVSAGDVVSVRMGKNVGFEQDGKGELFLRPVLVVRKFNKEIFFGAALSTRYKDNGFYLRIGEVGGRESVVVLSQVRLFDTKRVEYAIGHVPKEILHKVRGKLAHVLLHMNI